MKMPLLFPCLNIQFVDFSEWLFFLLLFLVQWYRSLLCNCRHWNSGFFSFELDCCFGTKMILCFIKKCMLNKCRKFDLYNHTIYICINDRYLNLGMKGTPLAIVRLVFIIMHRRRFYCCLKEKTDYFVCYPKCNN